ncbi:MAG: alkaline phosphatase family protein [Ardenticatenia bacterium]|nr:alkaline phosphatase family protein [Ardenticatenia bacterium]
MTVDKVLIIGWDGATWDYMDPLLGRGELPHLAALLARGARAVLRSTIPPYTNVAWPSLVTGLGPAKTGVFDGARARPGSYEAVPTNLTGYRGVPIWRWVNRYGLRAGVLNVPMTYPAAPLDGYLVAGFDSPRGSAEVAYPRDLLRRWAEQGRPYRVLAEEIALMDRQNPHQPRGDLEEFVARWVALTREQGELVAWLWRAWPVDMMFVVFSGTDSVNHRTRDVEHIARVYRSADEALGRILEAVDERTLVCLVSDHGSTPAHRYIALYRALHDGGWLRFRPQVAERFWRRLPGPLGRGLPRLWRRLPDWARQALSWPLLRWDPRLAVVYENVDWSRTRVYARSGMGPLYVNLQGRQPRGIVPPAAYDALCDEVAQALLALRDPEGRPLFGRVWRRDELYPGADPGDDPPDLVVEPARWSDHVITGYPSDPPVCLIPKAREYGTHTPDGVLVLAGPGVRAGVELEAAQIVDVVPTLLALLDLPLPAEVDGQVLREALAEEPTVRYAASEAPAASDAAGYTDEEAEDVMQRLRDLGYL